jgi:beta-barrel assembly-enhancing protease
MRYPSCAWLAVAGAVWLSGAGCGSSRAADRDLSLTVGQKIDIGLAVVPRLEQRFGGRLDQPAVQAYVRTVGQRVALSVSVGPWPYHFSALDSPVVGVFSLPGGQVYVTRGLLEKLRTEGELAAVFGHELAHGIAGHGDRLIGRKLGPRVLIEAGRAAAARSDGPASRWDRESLDRVAAAWIAMRYSDEMEREADRLGLDYLVAAGYDPGEMVRLAGLWVEMTGPDAAEFQAVHPNPPDRVGAVQEAVQSKFPVHGGRVGRQEYRLEVLDRLKVSP